MPQIEEIDETACRRMWLAVVGQAVRDATAQIGPQPEKCPVTDEDRRAAVKFYQKKGLIPPNHAIEEKAQKIALSRWRAKTNLWRERARDQSVARNWLLEPAPGFDTICDFAGVNPAAVRSLARGLSAAGWPHREIEL